MSDSVGPSSVSLSLTIHTESARRLLTRALLMLLACHTIVMFVRFGLGFDTARGLVPLFHFDSEFNVPTIYSVILMLIISSLILTVPKFHRFSTDSRFGCVLLGITFLFLAFDELFSLHEALSAIVSSNFDTTGAFHYAWVIPYGVAVICFALILLPWFLKLERETQVLFALSGLLYVGGAIGMEMVGGSFQSTLDPNREEYFVLTSDLIATAEELLELSGLSLFAYSLIRKLVGRTGQIRIDVSRMLMVPEATPNRV